MHHPLHLVFQQFHRHSLERTHTIWLMNVGPALYIQHTALWRYFNTVSYNAPLPPLYAGHIQTFPSQKYPPRNTPKWAQRQVCITSSCRFLHLPSITCASSGEYQKMRRTYFIKHIKITSRWKKTYTFLHPFPSQWLTPTSVDHLNSERRGIITFGFEDTGTRTSNSTSSASTTKRWNNQTLDEHRNIFLCLEC